MSERGRVSVIRDPAIAVAASKCYLARWQGGKSSRLTGIPIDSFHPQDCGFCEYPTDRLIQAVTEFSEWASLQPVDVLGEPQPMRQEVELFVMLPRHEQHRLVEKAQGYGEEDEAAEGP